MSDDLNDEDIIPVFAFRADNIMKKQLEAYEEILKKIAEEEEAEKLKNVENDLLAKIHKNVKEKPNSKKNSNVLKASSSKSEEEFMSKIKMRRSNRRKKELPEDKSTEVTHSPIKLNKRAKKRLLKMDLENKLETKRIQALNDRVLKSCLPSSIDDQNTSIDIDPDENITLKISYLSEISKITVSENEKFSSILSKVADNFKLQITEVALCLRDEIINLDATPHSLNVKMWEIIECIPYKSSGEMMSCSDSNKILIKMQSNDSRKKVDIFAHKLEKFQDIMERYANLRDLPLTDLVFKFDGEKISGSDTPNDLDMESESCVDVKVLSHSLKPTPPAILFVDLEKEEPPHKMLNICVLD